MQRGGEPNNAFVFHLSKIAAKKNSVCSKERGVEGGHRNAKEDFWGRNRREGTPRYFDHKLRSGNLLAYVYLGENLFIQRILNI
jgi:hypothetical protein